MKFYLILGLFVMSVSSIAQNTTIGDVDMGEVNNSKAFEQIKKMLGKWEGKLYQQSGAVVDTSSEFKLVSNGNTIVEKLVEDGVELVSSKAAFKDGYFYTVTTKIYSYKMCHVIVLSYSIRQYLTLPVL